nr:MAG TPA: hypothetical protein [Caudoviricetes sp.]
MFYNILGCTLDVSITFGLDAFFYNLGAVTKTSSSINGDSYYPILVAAYVISDKPLFLPLDTTAYILLPLLYTVSQSTL